MMARTNQGSFEWMSWRSLGRKNYSHWYLWKKKTTSWGSPTRVGYSNWNQLSTTRPFTNLPRYPPIHVVPADHILNWWHWGKSLVYPTYITYIRPSKLTRKTWRLMKRQMTQMTFFPFGMVKSSKESTPGPLSNEQFSCWTFDMTLLCESLGDPTSMEN